MRGRRPALRGLFAALAVVAVVGCLPAVALADDDSAGGGTISVTVPERSAANLTNAELRWGLNHESGGGSFVGGCNFLSAGLAGNSGAAKPWTAGDKLYKSSDGAVRIVKATSGGGWTAASFASRCLDPKGRPVDVNDVAGHTDTQVVMGRGVGEKQSDGSLRIRWSGSFTVAFYGGMSYWSVTDPVLTMDASGNGRLTANLSGYATSQTDLGQWKKISSAGVVLADIRGAAMLDGGFAQAPRYVGVSASIDGQVARSAANSAYWGAFPSSFLGFMQRLGQGGYWMATGGQRDAAKPATTLYVNYDAARPAVSATTAPVSSGGGVPQQTSPLSVLQAAGARAPGAAAAAAAVPVVATGAVPASVSRSAAALIPAARGGVPAWLLPAGVTVLALLVGALAALDLGGFRIRLWPQRPAAS